MGWDNNNNNGSGDSPPTSFVRLPDKADRPAPRSSNEAPAPPVAWAPPSASRPASAPPPASAAEAPFGGFQRGTDTAMVRRQTDSSKFLAVLGVLFAMLVLGGAAIWMAIKVLDRPDLKVEQKDLGNQTPPPPPPPRDIVGDDDEDDPEVAEPTTTTGTKTGSTSTKSGTKSGTTSTKSGSTSTKSGTTSTKSGTTSTKTIGSGANRNNRSGGTSGH